MSQLIARGVRIEEFKCYAGSSGGAFTMEIKLRAVWTKEVCENMGWTPEPSGFGNGKLDGKLFGVSMQLEPNAKTLKDYAIDISIGQFDSFRHIIITEDGDVRGHEFEFTATASGENALKALPFVATYIEKCGPAGDRGRAKLTYNAKEQQSLPTGEGEEAPEANEKVRGRNKAAEAVQ